jgi:hypothetical protein
VRVRRRDCKSSGRAHCEWIEELKTELETMEWKERGGARNCVPISAHPNVLHEVG